MKKIYLLIALSLSFSACLKEQYKSEKASGLKWFCGEGIERVVEEVAVQPGATLELEIAEHNFCAGSHGIRTEIRRNGQLLFEQEDIAFPVSISFPVSVEGLIQVSTEVILGPELKLCSRLGLAKVELNYLP